MKARRTSKWTWEQIERLRNLYPTAKTWEELVIEFPFSTKRGIDAIAQKMGIKDLVPRDGNQLYRHNETLFDKWNEQSCYILGYLEADGYFNWDYKQSVQITFATSPKDLEYLNRLKETIGSDAKILKRTHHLNNGKTYIGHAFIITSRQWKDFLRNHIRSGRIPKDIPKNLIHHYVRGYFDGDGSIYFEKQSQDYKSSIVFNSESLAYDFRDLILGEGMKVSNIHQKTNSQHCWYFQLSTFPTKEFGRWMYTSSSIYLPRKKMLFDMATENYGG